MGASNWVHIECKILRETENAFLVNINDDDIWLPKSQIDNADTYGPGDYCTLSITEWIARKNGIS